MNEIKSFLCKITDIEKTIIYELDTNLREEQITKLKNTNKVSSKNKLNSKEFADKIYIINKNVNGLKEKYISNITIDGVTIEIEIVYKNNEIKKVVCKNSFPEEINNIRHIIKI